MWEFTHQQNRLLRNCRQLFTEGGRQGGEKGRIFKDLLSTHVEPRDSEPNESHRFARVNFEFSHMEGSHIELSTSCQAGLSFILIATTVFKEF